jgi:hypothetical protein
MDDEWRRNVAIWKATVLGPLVSARLEHGDLREQCTKAATRQWEHPNGRFLTISDRTVGGIQIRDLRSIVCRIARPPLG